MGNAEQSKARHKEHCGARRLLEVWQERLQEGAGDESDSQIADEGRQ